MPFAFVHLAGAWLAGKVHQSISGKPLSHYVWIFLLIGSILPDIDHLVDWTFGMQVHRSFTHSIFFVFLSGVIVYVVCKSLPSESKSFALAVSCGVFIHLLLDMLSHPGVPLLWPSQLHFSITSIGYPGVQPSLFNAPLQELRNLLKLAVFDMAVGTIWLFYFAFKKNIKF